MTTTNHSRSPAAQKQLRAPTRSPPTTATTAASRPTTRQSQELTLHPRELGVTRRLLTNQASASANVLLSVVAHAPVTTQQHTRSLMRRIATAGIFAVTS